jgi:hypothetical protein
MKTINLIFSFERATKRKFVFKEEAEEGKEIVGALYVTKTALKGSTEDEPFSEKLEVSLTFDTPKKKSK